MTGDRTRWGLALVVLAVYALIGPLVLALGPWPWLLLYALVGTFTRRDP